MPTGSMKICPQCGEQYTPEHTFCSRDGSSLRSPDAENPLVGSVLAGRYHVLSMLGEGGMGQVYLAEHVNLKNRVAVKVISRTLLGDTAALGRFTREARNSSSIAHPHVATVFDFGEADGVFFLVMEYIAGQSLARTLEESGMMAMPRVAAIIGQVAEALAAAHRLNIVHRDLKPENVMLSEVPTKDFVKLVDFGISKATGTSGQSVTNTGMMVGTPAYMSPEQVAAKGTIDHRSDVFALAIVAFKMLTGALPFPGETTSEQLGARLMRIPAAKLKDAQPTIAWPANLQRVLDRGMAENADERYQSAEEFARDLAASISTTAAPEAARVPTAIAEGKTIATPPPRPSIPMTPVARAAPARGSSRKVYVAGGVVLLVAALVVVFYSGDRRAAMMAALPGFAQSGASSSEQPADSAETATERSSIGDDMLRRAMAAYNDLNFARADSLTRDVLSLGSLTRQQRVDALLLRAGAAYPDDPSSQRRDDAIAHFRAALALDPNAQMPIELRWRGLDSVIQLAGGRGSAAPAGTELATPVTGRSSVVDDLLKRGKDAFNDLNFARADTLAAQVLISTGRVSQQQRIEALLLRAAAAYPDDPSSQRRDAAVAHFRAALAIDPNVQMPAEFRWAGLDSVINEARRGRSETPPARGIDNRVSAPASAIAVDEKNPATFYLGLAGGVWKASNNGTEFQQILRTTMPIGDIALAPSNPSVIYVGTGQITTVESAGTGVWKSINGGSTFRQIGLEAGVIARVAVHPANPNIAWVAAGGERRGVWRTTDGGASWTLALFADENHAPTDLVLHPTNPQILFVAMSYTPRRRSAGDPRASIFKTTDGGQTWSRLFGKLPSGAFGRVALDISRSNPYVVYAQIEVAPEDDPGGSEVWRSVDGGTTWALQGRLRMHPTYLSRLRVDPRDWYTLFVVNGAAHKSSDGGKSWQTLITHNLDHHAIWLDPGNSRRVLLGHDESVDVSWNAGGRWETLRPFVGGRSRD